MDTCLFDRLGSPHTHEVLGFSVRIVGCRAGFQGSGVGVRVVKFRVLGQNCKL